MGEEAGALSRETDSVGKGPVVKGNKSSSKTQEKAM